MSFCLVVSFNLRWGGEEEAGWEEDLEEAAAVMGGKLTL